jgi:hypothetical protein
VSHSDKCGKRKTAILIAARDAHHKAHIRVNQSLPCIRVPSPRSCRQSPLVVRGRNGLAGCSFQIASEFSVLIHGSLGSMKWRSLKRPCPGSRAWPSWECPPPTATAWRFGRRVPSSSRTRTRRSSCVFQRAFHPKRGESVRTFKLLARNFSPTCVIAPHFMGLVGRGDENDPCFARPMDFSLVRGDSGPFLGLSR